ncbi:kinase [Aureococcus anophagefferens]|nr:kinase [Aureococcus anophagefferens]
MSLRFQTTVARAALASIKQPRTALRYGAAHARRASSRAPLAVVGVVAAAGGLRQTRCEAMVHRKPTTHLLRRSTTYHLTQGNLVLRWFKRAHRLRLALRVGYLTCLGASAVSLGVVCLNEAAPLPSALVEAYWRYAIWAVETAGPTFVKLAQWASTRPDMFDAALCARFAVLHDATTPHAWAHTAEVMASAFGDDWARRVELEQETIGSGCIAQVYRGFCDGRKVAVKVCHPQIQEKVSADMRILAYFARWLGGKELVGAFGALMRDQMDLRIEARNLERFTANFGKERDVDVVFTHNFIHADLHPGNVLVDVDDERVRVGLLDAGLAYEVTNHKSFLNVVYHLMMREGSQAGAGVAMLDGVSDGAVEAARRDAYGAGVQRIVDAAKTEAFFDHLGSYIHDFFTLAYEHRVRLDHNYVCVALAVKVMEGLAIALDPQIDLLHAAMTYVAVAGRREAAKDLQSQISESLTWASRGSMTEQEKELEAAGHKVKKAP